MNHRVRLFKRDAATILWAAGIAVLLLLPGSILRVEWTWRYLIDSAAHCFLFLVLAILVWRSAEDRGPWPAATTFGICLAYAVILEVLQIPIPGRAFETLDILAAFLGILAALASTRLLGRKL